MAIHKLTIAGREVEVELADEPQQVPFVADETFQFDLHEGTTAGLPDDKNLRARVDAMTPDQFHRLQGMDWTQARRELGLTKSTIDFLGGN